MNEKLGSEQYANWQAPESAEKTPEGETGVDFVEMSGRFADGTAGEILSNTGAVAIETIALEPQGDERVWSEIPPAEQGRIKNEFGSTINKYNGIEMVEDGTSLMAAMNKAA